MLWYSDSVEALNGTQRITLVLAARVAICQSPSATTGLIPSSIALRSILLYQKRYKHTLLSFAMESKLVPDSDWIPSGPVYNNSMGIYVYCAARESAHHKRPTSRGPELQRYRRFNFWDSVGASEDRYCLAQKANLGG